MSSYGTQGGRSARGTMPVRRRTPKRALPNGKIPGGPKGLPPGLGGAPRGQGSGPERTAVVAQLRGRFGKRKGAPRD